MKYNMYIPPDAELVINVLENAGYEAFVVGGCVRDSVLGRYPKDWDICTSADVITVKGLFAKEYNVIETGLKHGTVTVMINQVPYEITTYRGEATDKLTLEQDLLHRDFTINAMAYNPSKGLVDIFGGFEDCRNGIIKCCGDSKSRFEEDPLRILRAIRFSAKLGFNIDGKTQEAMSELYKLLDNISAERINSELVQILVSEAGIKCFDRYKDIFAQVIPDIKPMFGFEQNNPHHRYDVWGHTIKALEHAPCDIAIRLAVLFHDIGKPHSYSEDEEGTGHFYGHGKVSSEITERVMKELKFDNQTIKDVTELVSYHDAVFTPSGRNVKRWLNRIGEEQLRRLLAVKRCDVSGQAEDYIEERCRDILYYESLVDKIVSEEQCFTIKDLAISGNDLIAIGIEAGPKMGEILKKLLDMVMNDEIENEYRKLKEQAEKLNSI